MIRTLVFEMLSNKTEWEIETIPKYHMTNIDKP